EEAFTAMQKYLIKELNDSRSNNDIPAIAPIIGKCYENTYVRSYGLTEQQGWISAEKKDINYYIQSIENTDEPPNNTSLYHSVNTAIELYNQTPFGEICDADTVLADIFEHASDEGFDITGLGESILKIWKKSKDKTSVEALFHALTDVTFEDFVKQCVSKTTRL
ncbi:MAG: hypothetical protein IJ192_09320, partial [Clostridia bacterium]|nr:hypothetical protein [Clostridia bacterium]